MSRTTRAGHFTYSPTSCARWVAHASFRCYPPAIDARGCIADVRSACDDVAEDRARDDVGARREPSEPCRRCSSTDSRLRLRGPAGHWRLGTGISVGAAGGSGVASWKGLLYDGVERCMSLGRCAPPVAERLRAQIEGDLIDLLCAAENISQRLNAPGPEYARWLEETVGALQVQNGGVIQALMDLGVTIATTNYDDLIEQVTHLRPVTWRERHRAESVLNGRSHGVLHLHGHWEDPASVVLGIRSYDAILHDRHAQGLLQAIRFTRTVVYIGFGAGLDDLNFGGFLRWTGEVFAESQFPHFRLCLESERESTRLQHPANQRIEPIAYGGTHAELPEFLRSLRGGAHA